VVLHGRREAGEVGHLRAEDEVTELGEGEEDDEEHDGEAGEIFGASSKCGRQLRHGLVEADVLEDLHENTHALFVVVVVVHSLPYSLTAIAEQLWL